MPPPTERASVWLQLSWRNTEAGYHSINSTQTRQTLIPPTPYYPPMMPETETTPSTSEFGSCTQHDTEIAALNAAIVKLTHEVKLLQVTSELAAATSGGCASPEIFQQMVRTNWHGRLGRTHMADVDGLTGAQLDRLDKYLRRTLAASCPDGGNWAEPEIDGVFLALKGIGVRLEDRMGFADVRVFMDDANKHVGAQRRFRNWAAHFYGNEQNNWQNYWRGVVMETLVELARYRGLFDDEGMLTEL